MPGILALIWIQDNKHHIDAKARSGSTQRSKISHDISTRRSGKIQIQSPPLSDLELSAVGIHNIEDLEVVVGYCEI